jgi:hypothetical protein
MVRSLHPRFAGMPHTGNKLEVIRKNLARAMVGSTVDLLADSHTIAHGIVSGIMMVSGSPKIVVNGQTYDINQVVTATTSSIP